MKWRHLANFARLHFFCRAVILCRNDTLQMFSRVKSTYMAGMAMVNHHMPMPVMTCAAIKRIS